MIGGGEKLVLTLAKELNADVITTDINKDSIRKMEFDQKNIISLGETIKLPILKQISASIKFVLCDFSDKYDFFIFSGNWAHFASKRHKPNLYYCHTPVRAFYDQYANMLARLKFPKKQIAQLWVGIHKIFHQHYIQFVDKIAVNSKYTQNRVKEYYKKDSVVIYPPINTSRFRCRSYGDFWLSVNRLYPEKRIELQIEAFRSLPKEKLIIVGGYSKGDHASADVDEIQYNKPDNVDLLFEITEKELIDLYAKCKGFITTSMNEDFGMAPVEAMASGKTVICVGEGGYLESVIDGVTGVYVKPDVADIIRAINSISNNPEKYKDACERQAKKFDKSIFIKSMKNMCRITKKKGK